MMAASKMIPWELPILEIVLVIANSMFYAGSAQGLLVGERLADGNAQEPPDGEPDPDKHQKYSGRKHRHPDPREIERHGDVEKLAFGHAVENTGKVNSAGDRKDRA